MGAAAGYVAGLASPNDSCLPLSPGLWVTVAACAGAVQLGLIWSPCTFLSVLRRPAWPVVAQACPGGVGLGPVVIKLFGLMVGI